ncbi:MAG TPA: acyl-CoA dehydrogenase family protein [Acetobacteraceae bacterium]|nr:acyl-CoA dehydrogenase family protein [Acetobacteraceae bacterium]
MNFDFSDDSKLLREQAQRFLREQCPPKTVRHVLEGHAPYSPDLWRAMAGMGWLGAAVPERYDGAGLGYEALCVLAEELGRVLAPVPFASTVYLAAEAILAAGSEAQKREYLPRIVRGELIATLALAEGAGEPREAGVRARLSDGRVTGSKWPVPDGSIAQLAVVVAQDATGLALALVDLTAPGVIRAVLPMVDPSRDHAKIEFDNAPATPLGAPGQGWETVRRLLDRAAVLTAFEQVGGAGASLEMATAYAKERFAFGRPIGSFQAIKHKLADVYVATELARSNAYYAAWALSADAAELPLAAATARVSATDAFFVAAKENIQVHGGAGFTWDYDCHLFYRRAKLLALSLGSQRYWKDRVVAELETRNAA